MQNTKTKNKKSASNTGRKRVTFAFNANEGSEVSVAGDFNNWDAASKLLKYNKSKKTYTGIMLLPEGTYEYKFIVDNKWCIDPENPHFATNAHGTLNSVLHVG